MYSLIKMPYWLPCSVEHMLRTHHNMFNARRRDHTQSVLLYLHTRASSGQVNSHRSNFCRFRSVPCMDKILHERLERLIM